MFQTGLVVLAVFAAQPMAEDTAGALIRVSEQIETQAQHRADQLRHSPAAPSPAADPYDSLLTELGEFALLAHQLSQALDQSGGPVDLRCIFRGMSEEAGHRANLLNQDATRGDHARVYLEIVRLTAQAQLIAATPEAERAAISTFGCSAHEAP